MDELTPDEKLLKLIDEPLPDRKIRPARRKKFGIKQGFKSLSWKGILKKLRFRLSLGFLNKLLIVISIFLTLYFVFCFFQGEAALKTQVTQFTQQQRIVKPKETKTFVLPSQEDYRREIGERNMFLPFGQKKNQEVPQKEEIPPIVKNLKLVGVIWSASPQAFLEDTNKQSTYLLSVEEGTEEYRIKQIFRDHIIIETTVDGESKQWELR